MNRKLGAVGRPTVCPAQEGSDELQNLKFLGVRSIEREEVEEVVGHDLPRAVSCEWAE